MHQELDYHCCTLMNQFQSDKRIPLDYSKKFREYSIPLINQNAQQVILFCPWCGKKLPGSLRSKYFNVLENEYNINDPFDNDLIPEDFFDDTWWKKRGLR